MAGSNYPQNNLQANNSSFPTYGLVPKEETGAAAFIRQNPKYDGRGVICAILDTGVDPGAPGMQVTSDGKPKVISVIDCTGSGDVDTSTIVQADKIKKEASGTISFQGLSGRTLSIPSSWKNPSGEWRIGLKRLYELFPDPLLKRLTKERKTQFSTKHQTLLGKAQNQLMEFEKKNDTIPLNDEQLQEKANLKAKIDALNDLFTKFEDPGAVIDCVVFNDGTHWRAVLDVDETGDMSKYPQLTDFRTERQISRFGDEDFLNFSVNIYDNGNTVSVVTLAGSHGTHCAAICGANFPEDPAINGVAPGVQIVSLKIGDTRLGSMETCTGLVRAANAIVQEKCDIVNMSYGEDPSMPNKGYFVKLLRDHLINNHNVVFVSSAGNAGPALSTVGAPGGTTSGVIGVGAYVTKSMQAAEYALIDYVPNQQLTFTSMGPAYDGDRGVNVYGPGAAITSIPQYCLAKSQMMNGTSMSSPNVTGGISLVLSALKAQNIPYTPYRIEKAVTFSAQHITDPLNVGFFQVGATYDYVTAYKDCMDEDIQFNVTLPERQRARGVYLREWQETNELLTTTVSIEAKFKDGSVNGANQYEKVNSDKLNFEKRIQLVCTAPWVKAPQYLHLNTGGRSFQINVDPTSLTAGDFHYAEIEAFDANDTDRKMFYVPISVAKPLQPANPIEYKIDHLALIPGKVNRKFIRVPPGAQYCDVTVTMNESSNPIRLVVHLVQTLPQIRHTKTEQYYAFALNNTDPKKKTMLVKGGATMEIALCQYWNSPGWANVSFQIDFHSLGGVQSSLAYHDTPQLTLDGHDGISRITFEPPFRSEPFEISASLNVLRRFLRPNQSTIKLLNDRRDVLPNDLGTFELVLTYDLKVAEKQEITIRVPSLNDYLYDSQFSGVLYLIHDANKKSVFCGDIYPKGIKLEKGDYTIRYSLRHDSVETLEKFKNLILQIESNMPKSKDLELYDEFSIQSTKSKPFKNQRIQKQESKPVYFDTSSIEAPKDAKAGDQLIGNLNLLAGKTDAKIQLKYIIPVEAKKPREDNAAAKEEVPTLLESQCAWLKKATDKPAKEALVKELLSKHPKEAMVLISKLEMSEFQVPNLKTILADPKWRAGHYSKEINTTASDVLKQTDQILGSYDLNSILAYYGSNVKVPNSSSIETDRQAKKDHDKKKEIIVKALAYRTQAQFVLDDKEFDTTLNKWERWLKLDGGNVEANHLINKYIGVKHALKDNLGLALVHVNKCIDDVRGSPAEVEYSQQRKDLLQSLGWDLWLDYEVKRGMYSFPKSFAPI